MYFVSFKKFFFKGDDIFQERLSTWLVASKRISTLKSFIGILSRSIESFENLKLIFNKNSSSKLHEKFVEFH